MTSEPLRPPDMDADTLVDCTCGHRKDAHVDGAAFCKMIGCRCPGFTFRSAEDRAKFDAANDPNDPFRMAQISQISQTDMNR